MSTKRANKSRTSTRSARSGKNVERRTPDTRADSSPITSQEPELVASQSSRSRIEKAYSDPSFRLAWDNNVAFQIARHVLLLRQHRGWSQETVAQVMGTSQPAIARIENSDGNITLGTLERLIIALKGRFQVSIPPAEIEFPRWPAWWDVLRFGLGSGLAYNYKGFVARQDGPHQQIVAAWETVLHLEKTLSFTQLSEGDTEDTA